MGKSGMEKEEETKQKQNKSLTPLGENCIFTRLLGMSGQMIINNNTPTWASPSARLIGPEGRELSILPTTMGRWRHSSSKCSFNSQATTQPHSNLKNDLGLGLEVGSGSGSGFEFGLGLGTGFGLVPCVFMKPRRCDTLYTIYLK